MKKLLPMLLALLLLPACTNGQLNEKKTSSAKANSDIKISNKLNISDIFPFKKNVKLNYTGSVGDSSNSYFYVDYLNNDRLQFRMVTADTSSGYVLENKNGELRMITSREKFFYHDDLTNYQNASPEIILKEPLAKGTSWLLPNGKKRYISNDNVQIATASLKYITIEVTTETDTGKIVEYYAPNTGLVEKIIYVANNKTITYLESTSEEATSNDTVKFYYTDLKDKNTYYYQRQLHFKTNDDMKTYFEKYFKEVPNEKFTALISKSTKINSLHTDINTKTVYMDFSKEFITENKLDLVSEKMVLQSITNTICDYYDMDKLLLTVEGNPYSSGNISMKQNEPLYMIDVKSINEYK